MTNSQTQLSQGASPFYADYPRSNEQGWTSEELEAVEAIKRAARLTLQAERAVQTPTD